MKKATIFFYGVVSYALALATFAYLAGFIGNFLVPLSLDSPARGDWQTALLIDLGLLMLFALQHSIMARPAFKRLITQVIPAAAERSTYVMATNLVMFLLFWKWQPLGGVVWQVDSFFGAAMLHAGYVFGWSLLLLATFVINHFDLFGLRQVWRAFRDKPQTGLPFAVPFLYRIVRHPLYIGWFLVFWCAPLMTVAHLVFAVATTVYILVAIQLEEADLVKVHPEYAEYRKQVPMLVPGMPRQISLADAPKGLTAE